MVCHISRNLNDGANLMGLENDGGDIIILPEKKKKGRKRIGKNQLSEKLNMLNTPKLSKSQNRKLKKLEEEKEKEMLLAESMATLEKYKIGEDVYSLMWSSKNSGQVETVREKRRREVEFAKSGLQLPDSDQPFAKRRPENASHDAEVFEEKIQSPANYVQLSLAESLILNDTSISVESFESEVCDNPPVTSDGYGLLSVEEVANDSIGQSMLNNEEMITSKDALDEDPKYNLNQEKNQKVNCSSARQLVAPTVVHISRPKDVEKQRMGLPIVMMEQEIMEAINDNISVIICGETGCGKTTQVPQFLYEAGFGSKHLNAGGGIIGITQPRRVAVLATARRVAFELGVRLGKEVGFQVRHDRRVGENCSMKFMTDGILLREVQSDVLLKRYSVIILDEAHERTLNTDILIGMLSRVIQLRQSQYEEQQKMILAGENIECGNRIYPLKLVLMSATLRVEDFVSGTRIFREPPPVIEVPTRQYPVTIHFSKKTLEADYIAQAFKKVISIHKRLPPGGILVFVTGQREVEYLCQRLRRASREIVANVVKGSNKVSSISDEKCPEENNMEEISEAFEFQGNPSHEITERLNSYTEEGCEDFLDDNSDVRGNAEEDKSSSPGPLRVLPLYAMLPAASQLRVFGEGSEGERLVVVATNVAETSLTIPGIKYVVDTGKEKVKNYNSSNGMETYKIQWISKASAAQRAGRAGRTGPGLCYRLYSSAAFGNEFPDFSQAEISKVPVDGVVLLMKSMNICKVANFPFPTPPETGALIEAERCLKVLEALDKEGKLTSLGKAMARYPMSPRHSRMLLTVIQILQKAKERSRANLVLAYAVAAAAALSLQNPFLMHVEENQDDGGDDYDAEDSNKKVVDREERAKRKKSHLMFSNPTSDALTIAFALQCFEVSDNRENFCKENSLHQKTMEEMSKLWKQLLNLVFRDTQPDLSFSWNHGTIEDVKRAWRVCSNKNPLQLNEEEILGKAIFAGWADRVAKKIGGKRYQACMVKETVFLHRRSSTSKSPPEFLVYSELLQAKRPYIHGATSVKACWLPQYAPSLCSLSSIPLSEMQPYYDRKSDQLFSWATPTFRPHLWKLPPHKFPIEDQFTRVIAFAYSLLKGKILPCLENVRQFMAAAPESILKPESRGLRRVGNLLSKLNNAKGRVIDSCAELRELWGENPRELFIEIQDWFQEGFRIQFEELWAEMVRQVFLDSEERFPYEEGQ